MFEIIIGIFLASSGFAFILLYTNLLTIGYSFLEFVKFISTRIECLLFFIGTMMIIFSIERRHKNVLLLRHSSKFWRR